MLLFLAPLVPVVMPVFMFGFGYTLGSSKAVKPVPAPIVATPIVKK